MREADEQVIVRVLAGGRNAYALLVDKYKDRVFTLVLGIVHQRELAEEVAQDVFVKAYQSLGKFRKESGFSTWIYRIAYNAAISEVRKKKMLIQNIEQLENVGINNQEIELEKQGNLREKLLESAMKELVPEENLLVTLYYFEEKSVEEISLSTGLSQSNVKVKLFRLRNKLKETMLKYGRTELAIY
jgi:RNA polymerase sigma-70 factor (ECF subfamily)